MPLRIMPLEERIVLDAAVVDDATGSFDAEQAAGFADDAAMHEAWEEARREAREEARREAEESHAPLQEEPVEQPEVLQDPGAVSADGSLRVLLINSRVEDNAVLAEAATDDVLAIRYNGRRIDSLSLLAFVEDALGGRKAASVGLVTHDRGEGRFSVAEDGCASIGGILHSDAQRAFWSGVGDLIAADGRIDLFSCDLAAYEEGTRIMDEIEILAGCSVAASDDATGNPSVGGDWFLERGRIDLKATYFEPGGVEAFGDSLQSAIWYVDINAEDGGNGSSWGGAFNNLESALGQASDGDKIYVATGVYTPDAEDSEDSFQLPDDVAIYGGFDPAGGGVMLSMRDFAANPTILSGEIGNPDTVTDNTRQVVKGDDDAILDGFIITGGNAGGLNGGGMYNSGFGDMTVSNCIFINNSASQGGAMYNTHGSFFGGDLDIVIQNCVFSGNNATAWGGAIQNYNDANAMIYNCAFTGNYGSSWGGAMENWSDSDADIANCTFVGNRASSGGGLDNFGGADSDIFNSLFYGNEAFNGGAIYEYGGSDSDYTNTIMWGNNAQNGDEIHVSTSDSSAELINSCVQGGIDLTGVIDSGGNITANPQFVDLVGMGYWTDSPSFDPQTGMTALTVEGAQWTENEFQGMYITPDTNDLIEGYKTYYILSNTQNTITIGGDPRSFVQEGAFFEIRDFRLTTGSPCRGAGNEGALLPSDEGDLDGDTNTNEQVPYDITSLRRLHQRAPSINSRISGTIDMGPWEMQGSLSRPNMDPYQITLSPEDPMIEERAEEGTYIGTISGEDPENDELTFSVADDPHGWFAVNEGALVVAQGAEIDWDVTGEAEVVIRAEDGNDNAFESAFIIEIEDAEDGPTTLTSLTGVTVPDAWYNHGCSPTSAGMMLGFYDLGGYEGLSYINLIGGGEAEESTYAEGDSGDIDTRLNQAIASPEHINDFCPGDPLDANPSEGLEGDDVANPRPPSEYNCIADFAGTSQDQWGLGNYYTKTVPAGSLESIRNFANSPTLVTGIDDYVKWRGYDVDGMLSGTWGTDNLGDIYGPDYDYFSFTDFKREIRSGRPVIVNVTGHSMLGYGYDDSNEGEVIYVDDTWSNDGDQMIRGAMDWNGDYMGMTLMSITTVHLTGGRETPQEVNNGPLEMDQGAVVTITTDDLLFESTDGYEVTYTVETTPADGTLFLDEDGNQVLGPGESIASDATFTQEQIDDGLLMYQHDDVWDSEDQFVFEVADEFDGDQTFFSQEDHTFVFDVNTRPKQVNNEGLTLDEGDTGNITEDLLWFTDLEDIEAAEEDPELEAEAEEALEYVIEALPEAGTIWLDADGDGEYDSSEALQIGDRFEQGVIREGRLYYTHDWTDLSDDFDFTVYDSEDLGTNPRAFLFTLNEVNEDPEVDDDQSTAYVWESTTNPVGGGTDGDVVASLQTMVYDPDVEDGVVETHTFEMVSNPSGIFAIEGNNLVLADASLLDYETADSHEIQLQVSDSRGGSADLWFTVEVKDVDEAPSDLGIGDGSTHVGSVDEATVDATVGTLVASDPDIGDVYTYEIVGGDGEATFHIVNDELRVLGELDYFQRQQYTLEIMVRDRNDTPDAFADPEEYHNNVIRSLTINVNEINEAPLSMAFSHTRLSDGTERIRENSGGGTVVGELRTNDPDDPDTPFEPNDWGEWGDLDLVPGSSENYTYVLLDEYDGGDRFIIQGNQVVVNPDGPGLDYEAAGSYTLRAEVSDRGGLGTQSPLSFVVSLKNVNDAPDDIFFVADDERVERPSIAESVAPDAEDPDAEGALDGDPVGQLYASDDDLQSTDDEGFSFTLTDDAGGRFSMVEDGGIYRIYVLDASLLDREADGGTESHQIGVRVTDRAGVESSDPDFQPETIEMDLAIYLDPVNEYGPTDISLANNTVEEEREGAPVGGLSVVDRDIGDEHGYTVADNRFEITTDEEGSATLKLREDAYLDAESPEMVGFSVGLTVTDSGGLSYSESLGLQVTDRYESTGLDAAAEALVTSGVGGAGYRVGLVAQSGVVEAPLVTERAGTPRTAGQVAAERYAFFTEPLAGEGAQAPAQQGYVPPLEAQQAYAALLEGYADAGPAAREAYAQAVAELMDAVAVTRGADQAVEAAEDQLAQIEENRDTAEGMLQPYMRRVDQAQRALDAAARGVRRGVGDAPSRVGDAAGQLDGAARRLRHAAEDLQVASQVVRERIGTIDSWDPAQRLDAEALSRAVEESAMDRDLEREYDHDAEEGREALERGDRDALERALEEEAAGAPSTSAVDPDGMDGSSALLAAAALSVGALQSTGPRGFASGVEAANTALARTREPDLVVPSRGSPRRRTRHGAADDAADALQAALC